MALRSSDNVSKKRVHARKRDQQDVSHTQGERSYTTSSRTDTRSTDARTTGSHASVAHASTRSAGGSHAGDSRAATGSHAATPGRTGRTFTNAHATRMAASVQAIRIPRLSIRRRLTPAHPGGMGAFHDVDLPPSDVSASSADAAIHGKGRRRKPSWLTRLVNRWVNRLVGAVADGTFADQEAQYESHRTSRDYVWNAVGLASWGVCFPVLSIVVTQLVGTEQAGMFTMAFTVALLLMFLANYGVRTYQVSDLDEEYSFSDYQANRILTCTIMMALGFGYGAVRGYGSEMMIICFGVYLYKMVDGWADVYEGRLQQMDKLYLAGISQALRSITVMVVFSLVLLITRNLMISCVIMGVVALLSLFFITIPLALFETPKSRRFNPMAAVVLVKQCFPLFAALFMYNLIENMPKFIMEGMLPYDNQLYYNAMWFPANALTIVVQVIYKPLLVRMAGIWADMRTRKRFDILVVAMLLVVVLLTSALAGFMGALGPQILGLLYGVDFEPYRGLIMVMVVAGGVSAAIDFIYQAVTLLRKQGSVTKLYLITFGFSLFIPLLLVSFTELPGAVLSYLIIMSFLLVLLVWEYLRIRIALANEPAEDVAMTPARRAPEAAAQAGQAALPAGSHTSGAVAARTRARQSHADKLRRAEAAAKRAERAARRSAISARTEARMQSGESRTERSHVASDERVRGKHGRST